MTVTLPERPLRVVADLNAASAPWDFGIRSVAVSGWSTNTDAAWSFADPTAYERTRQIVPIVAISATGVEPDVTPGEYWQELSPEQAMMYQSDVLFQSTRTGVFSLEELTAHPTYGRLPAVESEQIGPWNQDFIQSYQKLNTALESTMATLQDAEDVTP